MDSQFNTLIRSYHDNFLQYRLTGNSSYQQSYQSAQQGIETILSNLENQNTNQKKDISNFYNQDVEGRLRDLRSQAKDTQRKIITENDQVIAAQMRNQGLNTVSEPSMTSRYIALGVMSVVAFGLMAWRK
jgi:hypothetical protein